MITKIIKRKVEKLGIEESDKKVTDGKKRKFCEIFYVKNRKKDKITKKINKISSISMQKLQVRNGKKLRKC